MLISNWPTAGRTDLQCILSQGLQEGGGKAVLKIAPPKDHAIPNIFRLAICEEGPNIEWVLPTVTNQQQHDSRRVEERTVMAPCGLRRSMRRKVRTG